MFCFFRAGGGGGVTDQGQHRSGWGWAEGGAVPREVQAVGREPYPASLAADIFRHDGRSAQGAFFVLFFVSGFSTVCFF